MLGDRAVTSVVQHINGELGSPTAYKYERPQGTTGEYIAVNHLPFVHRGEVEDGIVNINIHVPTLKQGLPDVARLQQLAISVVNLFPKDTYLDGAYYEFYSDSRPTKDDDNTYYINLQMQVIFNDLNY